MTVCRAQHDSVRNVVVSDVTSRIEKLCHRRRLTCLVERVHDAGAVQCSPAQVEALTAAVKESEEVRITLNVLTGSLQSFMCLQFIVCFACLLSRVGS